MFLIRPWICRLGRRSPVASGKSGRRRVFQPAEGIPVCAGNPDRRRANGFPLDNRQEGGQTREVCRLSRYKAQMGEGFQLLCNFPHLRAVRLHGKRLGGWGQPRGRKGRAGERRTRVEYRGLQGRSRYGDRKAFWTDESGLHLGCPGTSDGDGRGGPGGAGHPHPR